MKRLFATTNIAGPKLKLYIMWKQIS